MKINENNEVSQFNEKPESGNAWINGGFFVLDPSVIDFISGDHTPWEEEPLQKITQNNQLLAFKHRGFWQPMDTIAEKKYLEELYETNSAPWKIWE